MELFSSDMFLLFLRILGVVFFLPGGLTLFPVTARLGTALALSLAFSGNIASHVGFSELMLPFEGMLEFLLGAFITLPFTLVVKVFLMFGSLLEQGRGQNLGGAYGASVEQEGAGQLGRLFEYGIIAVLFSSGLLLELVALLHESMRVLPVGSLTFHSGWGVFGGFFLEYIIRMLLMSFMLFLPFGMLFVLSDLAIGFVSKMVPGLPIFAEMFIAKSTITFLLILTAVFPSLTSLPADALHYANDMVRTTFEELQI